MSTSA
ncbi:hypothetical protein YPPY11_2908, partial [Yersinia pestis PY-11]